MVVIVDIKIVLHRIVGNIFYFFLFLSTPCANGVGQAEWERSDRKEGTNDTDTKNSQYESNSCPAEMRAKKIKRRRSWLFIPVPLFFGFGADKSGWLLQCRLLEK